jgi:hypothetical protein
VNTASTSPLTSIFDGKVCVGFTFARGVAGVETFNEFGSLGLFENQDAAIAATAANKKEKMPASVGSAAPAKLGNEHGDSNHYSKQLQV